MGQTCQSHTKTPENLQFSTIQTSKLNSEIHYKDRFFIMPLPQLPYDSASRNTILSKWLHEVVNNSMSVAFNYRRQQKMHKQATTTFACQNIIRNLIQMSYKQKFTQTDIAQLDQILEKKILPSIKVKYPMSQHKENNINLMQQFDVIDNFDTKQNDYVISSKVVFEFRTNTKYEDLIMSFLNELIDLPDQRVERIKYGEKDKLNKENLPDQPTLYQHFEEFMRQLFESVFDYETMNEGKWFGKNQNLKNKYREQVQSYTTYQIGRKIPSDAQKFDNEAIRTQEIKVKNSGVLRIMTKWAEQLWKKFEDKYYFINLVENPVLINKKESFAFSLTKKQKIQAKIQAQKLKIEMDMKVTRKKNQELQAQILNDTKNNTISYVPDLQLQETYFSGRTLSVLQVNLSKYLNRLIHGLVSVSKQFCEDFKMNPPILLFTTFKIGDIIRCKCKSKQKEIVYIYNQLKKISILNHKFLKIIRVKNRLEEGTRDILINIRFYERITAEIQLGIRSESKKYTQDSTEINHTLYELERAKFGPISELCSLLYNLNKDQSKVIQKAIDESLKTRKKPLFSLSALCLHNFKPYTEPFLCNTCFKLATSNQKIISNEECARCKYRECSNCWLKSLSEKQLKEIVFESQDLIKNSKLYDFQKSNLPLRQGIALYKSSRRRIVTAFRYFSINTTDTLVTCRQSSDPIVHKENWAEFCTQYLVWANNEVPDHIFKDHNQFTIIQACYLEQVFAKYCQKQRKKVTLEKCNMTHKLFQEKYKHNWNPQYCSKIQTLSLQCNQFTDMKPIFESAPNLLQLTLDNNDIKEISFTESMKTLKILSLKRNKEFSRIDPKIKHPKSLQKLVFGWNHIFSDGPEQKQKKIEAFQTGVYKKIPPNIDIFHNLTTLQVLYNGIRQMPESISKLKNLKYINLEGNFFEQIPKQILHINKIDKINMANNLIKRIPPQIKQLQLLRALLLPKNFISQIPNQLQELGRLETLGIQDNQISVYPQGLFNLHKLIRMNFNKNLLSNIDKFQNFVITQFLANRNQILTIPDDISINMKNLIVLQLCSNPIQTIPDKIWNLEKLEKLLLNECQLTNFVYPAKKFTSLKVLELEKNMLNQILPDIIKFPNLEELCITKNPIRKISNEMKHLKKLNYLTFDTAFNGIQLQPDSLKVFMCLKEYSWLTIVQQVQPN